MVHWTSAEQRRAQFKIHDGGLELMFARLNERAAIVHRGLKRFVVATFEHATDQANKHHSNEGATALVVFHWQQMALRDGGRLFDAFVSTAPVRAKQNLQRKFMNCTMGSGRIKRPFTKIKANLLSRMTHCSIFPDTHKKKNRHLSHL